MAERFPEGEHGLWKIYLRTHDGGLRCIATAPDAASLGVALETLFDEGEIDSGSRVGVYRGLNDGNGVWVVSPFTTGNER